MSGLNPIRPFFRLVLSLIALLACVAPAQAQMATSVSVYADWSVDSDGMITTWSDVEDNSPVCSSGHTDWRTFVQLSSPTARVSTGQGEMGGMTSMLVSNDYGSYVRSTSGSFFCSCGNQTMSFNGGEGSGLADERTIEVWFYYVGHRDNLEMQRRECAYRRCKNSPTDCWDNATDYTGLGEVCDPALRGMFTVKRFFGIVYSCEAGPHTHHQNPPVGCF